MVNIFFDTKLIKNSLSALCPSCKKEFKVSLSQTEIVCDECEEVFCPVLNALHIEDFVWHPSERY